MRTTTVASNSSTAPDGIPANELTVTQPAAGERIIGGIRKYRIEFTGGDVALQKTIEYSIDGGATWLDIGVARGDATSYPWNVPEILSVQVLVRVTDTAGAAGTSGTFTIAGGRVSAVREQTSVEGYSITNFPNPVSGATTIRLLIPTRSLIKIVITDELGKEIDTVAWRSFEAGGHSIPFNASELAAGMYTYTLEAGEITVTGTMTIVR